jgi:hypothetical protein
VPALYALPLLIGLAAPADVPPAIVEAPDSPVRLEHAHLLVAPDAPPVLLYEATNTSADDLEQFTVIAFVFDAQGRLKARQVAPGRRTLAVKSSKYSTLVLDGSAIEPTDLIVVGVNQAQKAAAESWWRADLQTLAEEAARSRKPRPK